MSCPVCGKAPVAAYRPFCSRRCADVDLARWLNESYRIPDAAAGADEPPETGEDTAADGFPPRPSKPSH